jgi:nucleoside-diphosphate-sugar epimerase
VRFIFTSTMATFGSDDPDLVVTDALRSTPATTYGATKRCAELLLNDYSRKGFVDGRAARLPTVIVRAGAPNGATTGCFSSVVREPLAGAPVSLPVGGDVKHAVFGYREAVRALLQLHEATPAQVARLGGDRSVILPCLTLSLNDLAGALRRVVPPAQHARLGAIAFAPDERLSAIVDSMPKAVDARRAMEVLGVAPPATADQLVRDYMADFPHACVVTAAAAAAGAAARL